MSTQHHWAECVCDRSVLHRGRSPAYFTKQGQSRGPLSRRSRLPLPDTWVTRTPGQALPLSRRLSCLAAPVLVARHFSSGPAATRSGRPRPATPAQRRRCRRICGKRRRSERRRSWVVAKHRGLRLAGSRRRPALFSPATSSGLAVSAAFGRLGVRDADGADRVGYRLPRAASRGLG